jgi:hypothetical protein
MRIFQSNYGKYSRSCLRKTTKINRSCCHLVKGFIRKQDKIFLNKHHKSMLDLTRNNGRFSMYLLMKYYDSIMMTSHMCSTDVWCYRRLKLHYSQSAMSISIEIDCLLVYRISCLLSAAIVIFFFLHRETAFLFWFG